MTPSSAAPKISDGTLRLAGIALLILYVLGGIAYSISLAPTLRFPDEQEYLSLSQNLLHGPGYSMDGVHLTAIRPPGYPFFLAGVQAVGGGIAAVRVLHFLLLGATVLLISRLCGPQPGTLFVVAALAFIYPVIFYTGGTLYAQTLAEFLFIAALVQLISPGRGMLLEFTAGLTFGALILAVPTFLLTLFVVLAVAAWMKIITGRGALLALVGAGFVVCSWTARNAVEFHRFVPVASNSGANFLLGNSENTTPYGGSGNIDLGHYINEAHAKGLDEFDMDRYFQHSGMVWIEGHPGRATVLYFEKTANFFSVWNAYAKGTSVEVSPWKQIGMAISYVLLIGLLGWRLWDAKRLPLLPWEKLFLIVYVLSAFTTAIFLTRIRFRLPYDWMLIAVVARFLSHRLHLWLAPIRN